MARIDPKSLTIDYKTLLKASVTNRMSALRSGFLNDTLFSLTPTQYAMLFPKYYMEKAQLPEGFGQLKQALSGMTPMSGGVVSGTSAPIRQTQTKPSWLTSLEKQSGMSLPSAQQLQQSQAPAGAKGAYRPVYTLSEADLSDDVINTIAGEARTTDQRGTDAVINNMLNRVGTEGWGPAGNMQQVARAPGQYTGYRRATPEEAAMIRERIKAVASGSVPDPTNGADSYRASSYLEGSGRGKTFDKLAQSQGFNNVGGNVFAKDPNVKPGPYAPYSEEQIAKNMEEQKQKDPTKSDIAVEDGPAGKSTVADLTPPKDLNPQVINYYNSLAPNQQQTFLQMIDKAGGVESVNKLYSSNPPQVANMNMEANIQSYSADGMKFVNFKGASMGPKAASDLGIPTDANAGRMFFGGRTPTPSEAEKAMVPVTSTTGKTFKVNQAAAGNFQGFLRELESMGYHINPKDTGSGGYNYRNKINRTNDLSEHSFGDAIDVNVANNGYNSTQNDMPPNVGQIASKYGLTWGGYWSDKYRDPMHFEYNPAHGVPATSNVQDFDKQFLETMQANPQTYINADVITPQVLAQNPNLSNDERLAAVQNKETSQKSKIDEKSLDQKQKELGQTETDKAAAVQQTETTNTDINPPESVADKAAKKEIQVSQADSSSWTSWIPFLKDGGEVAGENLAIVDRHSGETIAHSNDREGYQFSEGKIKVTPEELRGKQEVEQRQQEGAATKTPDQDLSTVNQSEAKSKATPIAQNSRFLPTEQMSTPPSLMRAYAKTVVAPFGAGTQNENR